MYDKHITVKSNASLIIKQEEHQALVGGITGGGELIKDGNGALLLGSKGNPGQNIYTLSGITILCGALAFEESDLEVTAPTLTIHGGTNFRDVTKRYKITTLNMRGYSATYDGILSAANAVMNFSTSSAARPTDSLLIVYNDEKKADVSGSTIYLTMEMSSGPPFVNRRYNLIRMEAENGLKTDGLTLGTKTVQYGVTTIYELSLITDNKGVAVIIDSGGINDRSKALFEGNLAGLILANQGASFVAERGIREAAQASLASKNGFAAFGGISGGTSRYYTGSHIDMDSLTSLAGLSWGKDTTRGRLTLGAFFEYGGGSYDTYNSFRNSASIRGDGDVRSIGGGLLGRMDFIDTGPGRFYAEASGRAGNTRNEYENSGLRDSQNRIASYRTSSAYYSFHLGAGYLWDITESTSLDLHGKYFWTRHEGDSVTLPTGDRVTFHDAESSRMRFGGRGTHALNAYVSPYIGAAYEHEFDGTAKGTANGFAIDRPTLYGDSGIGEIGLHITPSQTLPLSFDLGVQGYTGIREGVSGSFQAKFEF
jgi:hypothetical protein